MYYVNRCLTPCRQWCTWKWRTLPFWPFPFVRFFLVTFGPDGYGLLECNSPACAITRLRRKTLPVLYCRWSLSNRCFWLQLMLAWRAVSTGHGPFAGQITHGYTLLANDAVDLWMTPWSPKEHCHKILRNVFLAFPPIKSGQAKCIHGHPSGHQQTLGSKRFTLYSLGSFQELGGCNLLASCNFQGFDAQNFIVSSRKWEHESVIRNQGRQGWSIKGDIKSIG